MELHNSLGSDGEKGGLWFEYPLAFNKVKKKYKNSLRKYYRNYTLLYVCLIIFLIFIQQSLMSLTITLPIFILGYILIYFLNKIAFILHTQDLKSGMNLREVVDRRFKEEGRMETYQESRAKMKELINKMKAEEADREQLKKDIIDLNKKKQALWESIEKDRKDDEEKKNNKERL